jgi:hypothetical protein
MLSGKSAKKSMWAWAFLGVLSGCAGGVVNTDINRSHDAARIADDAPLTVDAMLEPAFLKRFAADHCDMSRDLAQEPEQRRRLCDDRLKQAMFDAFSERYFAADRKAIETRCKAETLACKDPKILEFWIRASHNDGIESSRQEKLAHMQQEQDRLGRQSYQNRTRLR